MTTDLTAGPAVNGTELLGRYGSYAAAQHAVDTLSDGGFPLPQISIVGDDLLSVEHVTGRMTVGRAAALGAAQGAWMGLVLTAIIVVVTPQIGWSLLLALPLAAGGGALFAGALHASTRGTRDFTSTHEIKAGNYAVLVNAGHAEHARRLLGHRQ